MWEYVWRRRLWFLKCKYPWTKWTHHPRGNHNTFIFFFFFLKIGQCTYTLLGQPVSCRCMLLEIVFPHTDTKSQPNPNRVLDVKLHPTAGSADVSASPAQCSCSGTAKPLRQTASMAAKIFYRKGFLLLLFNFILTAAVDKRFSDFKRCADEECSSKFYGLWAWLQGCFPPSWIDLGFRLAINCALSLTCCQLIFDFWITTPRCFGVVYVLHLETKQAN